VVGECLAAGVLAIPDCCGSTVGKADHIVFPACSQLKGL
jgi:predicted aconitase with swiveling domain